MGPITRAEYVREATRIQRLFRANRKKAMREILQGATPHCQIPLDDVQGHFNNLYAEQPPPEQLPQLQFEEPLPGSNDALIADFTEAEVSRRLRGMKNSSPGPDGLTYGDLRIGDPGAVLLTAIFNTCRRLGCIPAGWKDSNTVLMHKKGVRDDLSNWRPLAMGDVAPKLLAAVMADRLTHWAVLNKRLSPAQKGFLPYEGCLEHNFVLQEVMADARKRRREVVVAWLDLSNAFGSVPHATILGALRSAAVPQEFINIVSSAYDGCATRVRTATGFTDRIPMRSGVRQGCPLSPILFNLALEPVVRGAADSMAGHEIAGHRVTALAYADDIALVAMSPDRMRGLLQSAEETARALGLTFNPLKCASLHIKGNGSVAQTEFVLGGQPISALGVGEHYDHLGVPTGVQVDQTPYATIQGMLADLRAVDQSLLTPWQKVEATASFIMPRLDFLLRGARMARTALTNADKTIRRTAKSWLNLPQRASAELIYIPPSWGGCGLLPLADLAHVTSVAHAFRMLNAGDALVAQIARSSLERAARDKLKRPPTNRDLADYLSGVTTGEFARRSNGTRSFWSQVREAARSAGSKLGFGWTWSDGLQELSVVCSARNERRVVVPPSAKGQIIRRLRAAIAERYRSTLLSKPDQGKVFDATSRHGVSNHFMRGGSFTRFADWRFVHRARLDVLPLNGARRWGDNDKRCRRCGDVETLPHVLNHCGVHSAARQKRHHDIVARLAKAIQLPGEIRIDRRVPGVDDELAALRPDIVVTHEQSKTVRIVDVAVPFENTYSALQNARREKEEKYLPLAECLRRHGYVVNVDAFIVGSLGAWDPVNEAVLKALRISPRYAVLMRRLITSETIARSRDIYVEHVSQRPRNPAAGAAPAVAPGSGAP